MSAMAAKSSSQRRSRGAFIFLLSLTSSIIPTQAEQQEKGNGSVDQTCMIQAKGAGAVHTAQYPSSVTCQFRITFSEPNIVGETSVVVDAYQPEKYHYQDVFTFLTGGSGGSLGGYDGSCPLAGYWQLYQVQSSHVVAAGPKCQPNHIPSFNVELVNEELCRPLICPTNGTANPPNGNSPFPGIPFFSRGINTLSGNAQPIADLAMLENVITWYWAEGNVDPHSTSTYKQYVPDELIVVSDTSCISYQQTTEVTESTSTKAMESQSKANGVKINFNSFATTMAGVSTISSLGQATNKDSALQFKNSQESKTTEAYTKKEMSKHFSSKVRANRLSVMRSQAQRYVFDPTFYQFVMGITAESDLGEVFSFISKFGTAILNDVTLGATFENSAYFYTNESSQQVGKFADQVRTNGVGFPAFSTESSHESKTEQIDDTSIGVKGEWTQSQSSGAVNLGGGACGGLPTSSQDDLVPTSYNFMPLFMLPCVQSSPASSRLATFAVQFMEAALECGKQSCNSNGMCTPRENAYRQVWPGSYSGLLDPTSCSCFDYWYGDTCKDECDQTLESFKQTPADGWTLIGGPVESCKYWGAVHGQLLPYCHQGQCTADPCEGKTNANFCSNHGRPYSTIALHSCACSCDTWWSGNQCETEYGAPGNPCIVTENCQIPCFCNEGPSSKNSKIEKCLSHAVCREGKCQGGWPGESCGVLSDCCDPYVEPFSPYHSDLTQCHKNKCRYNPAPR